MRARTWLFDLDGTLVDTAPDLVGALNEMRARRGLADLPLEQLRHEASNGARGLLRSGLSLQETAPDYAAARQEFLSTYEQRLSRESRLYTGVDAVLSALTSTDRQWGIVTNKPVALARPLIRDLQLQPRVLLGGDSAARAKPAPDTLWLALAHLRVAAEDCVYLGDAARDIEAGHNAGTRTISCGWGYIAADDDPQTWGATLHCPTVADLLERLQ